MSRALLLSLAFLSACSAVRAEPAPAWDPALATLDAARIQAQQQADAAEQELDALRSELDALTAAGADGDGRATAVQGQLTRANARVTSLQAELDASARDHAGLLAARDAQITALSAQVQQLGSLSDGLAQDQRLAYESEIAALRADAWHAATLGPQLDAALQQLAASSDEAEHLGRRLGDLRQDTQRLESQLAATTRQLQAAPSAADLDVLRARATKLQAELTAANADQDRVAAQLTQARRDLADAKAQADVATTQLAQVRAELAQSQRALAAAQARPVSSDPTDLDALRKQIAQLQAENERLKQIAATPAVPAVRPPGKPVASAR